MFAECVSSQVNFALERPKARVTRERFYSGVLATMCDQVRRLTKGLATLATNVRLLT